MTQAQPPAGWYPDPQDATQQRYWDGTAWTGHTAAAGGAGAAPVGDAAAGATIPTASAPAWSMPVGGTGGMGELPGAKKSWYKRKAFIIPVVIFVVLVGLGIAFGSGGDHSNGLENAIKTDGQKQFQTSLSEAAPGSTVKVTTVDCVEKGDTQDYTCLIHLEVTYQGVTKNFLANAEGSCDSKTYAHCLWHTTGEPQPTGGS